MKILEQLLEMTHAIAAPTHGQVILGEGNTSAKDGETIWVKASGHQMANLTIDGFSQLDQEKLVQYLSGTRQDDRAIRAFLNSCRTDSSSPVYPSTEALMHAWLLTIPGVNFVAHTHPTSTLGIMSGGNAEQFAFSRYFPDQIVLCGPRSVYVPYVAPGFDLAVAIRENCKAFVAETGFPVKTILLQNHGLIAVGATPKEVLSSCLMMEKSAQVYINAQNPRAMSDEEVLHIFNWTDEHFRQSQIWKND